MKQVISLLSTIIVEDADKSSGGECNELHINSLRGTTIVEDADESSGGECNGPILGAK